MTLLQRDNPRSDAEKVLNCTGVHSELSMVQSEDN